MPALKSLSVDKAQACVVSTSYESSLGLMKPVGLHTECQMGMKTSSRLLDDSKEVRIRILYDQRGRAMKRGGPEQPFGSVEWVFSVLMKK